MTRRHTLTACYVQAVLGLAFVAILVPTRLAAQDRPPMTEEQVVRLIRSGVFSDDRIITLAEEACLAFRIDDDAEARLSQAGASTLLIRQLRGVCVRIQMPVSSVVVTPPQIELAAGDTARLRAQGFANDTIPVADVEFTWSSEDSSVARVRPSGTVRGVGGGTTRIIARSPEGAEGFASVTVMGPVAAQVDRGPQPKSVAGATILGIMFPGGGQYYAGAAPRGLISTLGAGGALAAGYLLTSTDTLSPTVSITNPTPSCDEEPGTCTFQGQLTAVEEETRQVVIGAAVAGAFWLYGLIDGVRSAKRTREALERDEIMEDRPGDADGRNGQAFSIEVAPRDGFAFRPNGDTDITFVRIRW